MSENLNWLVDEVTAYVKGSGPEPYAPAVAELFVFIKKLVNKAIALRPLSTPLNAFCEAAYANAADKGFYDKPPTFSDRIALMHSELSEALEDYRAGHQIQKTWYTATDGGNTFSFGEQTAFEGEALRKPCGIPSELADLVIRVFDFCGAHGIDLDKIVAEKMSYNATRSRMHGGKKL